MRYDQFGDMGHPIDRMAHKLNTTVPGILGYRPQRTDVPEDYETLDPMDQSFGSGLDGPVGPTRTVETFNRV